jgi:hypothetical protein
MLKTRVALFTLLLAGAAWAQLTVKNNSGDVLMTVDQTSGDAVVTLGSSGVSGHLTTESITITGGAGVGRVLTSDADGNASWGAVSTTESDPQWSANDNDHAIGNEFPLGGNAITISGDRTVNHANTSDQSSVNNSGRTVIQDVSVDGYGHITGMSTTTLADNVNDADHDPTGEIQTLSISQKTLTLSPGGGSVTLPPTWHWPTNNVSKDPVTLDVSTTSYGSLTFDVGVSGYTTAYFSIAGGSDGDDRDYLYLMKSNSGNWQDQQCGGVTLDYDDATLIAPIFEDPAGSGIYRVYWASRDHSPANLTQISLHIGLIGLAR